MGGGAAWVFAGLAATLCGALVAPAHAEASLLVTLDRDRVSITADGQPLREVLDRLATVARVQLVLDPPLEARLAPESVTLALEGVPVEEALRHLLRGHGVVLIFASDGTLAGAHAFATADGPSRTSPTPTPASVRSPARGSAAAGPPAAEEADRDRLARLAGVTASHPDPDRRIEALENLAESGNEALVRETAVQVLARDRDTRVLESTLDILGTLDAPPLDAIASFAAGSRDPVLRTQAIDILGDHREDDPRVTAWLRQLASDPDEGVRDAARAQLEAVAPR